MKTLPKLSAQACADWLDEITSELRALIPANPESDAAIAARHALACLENQETSHFLINPSAVAYCRVWSTGWVEVVLTSGETLHLQNAQPLADRLSQSLLSVDP